MSRKVIFLSQLFDPEYSIKGINLIRYLSNLGYQVEVVTTAPSYPKGKVFPGYSNRLKSNEHNEGVKITRLWSYITERRGKLPKILNYISFFFTSTLYLLFIRRPDIIYAYHPQVTTGVTGGILKKVRGIPFITDIQDLWPESLIAEGLNEKSLTVKAVRKLVGFSLHHANSIVVLSEGFKTYLAQQGIERDKIKVIHNWCPEEGNYLKTEISVKESCSPNYLTFVYTGNHGPLQSLDSLVKAFAHFPRELARLILVGHGSEKKKLVKLAEELGTNNISFMDFMPPNELKDVVQSADVMVCHLKKAPLFEITIPSKVQAYLCSGKAILIATGGEASKLVVQAGAGLDAEPANVESLISSIRKFTCMDFHQVAQMGIMGQEFYCSNLMSNIGYSKVKAVIEQCH